LLLSFLCEHVHEWGMTTASGLPERPEMTAASRGGDPDQLMDGEADLDSASLEQAHFWSKVYAEILIMETKVMERVQELMAAESPTVRREVELTNVPVIASQVERFRQRHEYWTVKLKELGPPEA
jgi:hypothetical protein